MVEIPAFTLPVGEELKQSWALTGDWGSAATSLGQPCPLAAMRRPKLLEQKPRFLEEDTTPGLSLSPNTACTRIPMSRCRRFGRVEMPYWA